MNGTGLRNGWAVAVPDDVAADDRYSLGIGPFGSNLKVSDYTDTGVPLVFVRHIRSELFDGHDSHFVSEKKAKELRAHEVHPGDVLITKMGDPPGDATLYPRSRPVGIITADCIKWRISPSAGLPEYFAYATRTESVRRKILGITKGVAQRKISLARFRSIEYPVAPLPEQRRIVEAIESYFTRLDDAVATLERVQRNLKRYRASVLKAAVEGRLVPTEAELARAENRDYEPASVLLERILAERRRRWQEAGGRGQYQEPVAPATTDLPELPEGWCWATMEYFAYAIEAGKNFRCIETPPGPGDVGVVKVSAVTWGTFDEDQSKTCPRPELVNEVHLISPGDFLISRANTIKLVGACVIVNAIQRRLMLSDKILRLRTVGDLDWWLLWVLRSALGRREIESLATGNQESMRNIGQDGIRRIRVPVPPEAECRRIITEIERQMSVFEHSRNVIRQSEQRCQRLRRSILKWAFEGKLADQDPGDEPASALLQRIRSQTSASYQSASDAHERPRRRRGSRSPRPGQEQAMNPALTGPTGSNPTARRRWRARSTQ